jgi:O-antigen/teichoic acid export membrane protein
VINFEKIKTKLFVVLKKPIFWSLGVNFVSLSLGVMIVLSLGLFFDATELGLYFTFTGLSVLVFFAEFGFGQIIIQLCKHYCSNAEKYALFKYSILFWFRTSSFLLFLVLSLLPFIVGFESVKGISYLKEWIVFSFSITCNYYLSKNFYLLQGEDKMLQYWRFRFFEFGLYSVTLLVFIALEFGILSLVLATLISLIINIVYIKYKVGFFEIEKIIKRSIVFDFWRREIATLQFKIGITWLGNNSVTRLITPVIFTTHSASLAGQYGMSLALITIAYSVSVIMINIKIPVLSRLAVEKDIKKFELLFNRGIFQGIASFMGTLVFGFLFFKIAIHYDIIDLDRLLDAVGLSYLVGINFLLLVISFISSYMRCFKEDYLAIYSVVANLVVIFSSYFALEYLSFNIFLSLYFLIIVMQAIISIKAFFRFRNLKTC